MKFRSRVSLRTVSLRSKKWCNIMLRLDGTKNKIIKKNQSTNLSRSRKRYIDINITIHIMQDKNNKKRTILNALALTMKELRGNKSQFIFSSENDISTSIISCAERGLKDPQLTTLFKLAEAYNISIDDFMKLIIDKLPDNFSLIEW